MTVRTAPRALAAATAALLTLGAAAGCSGGDGSGSDPGRVDVVAAFYPLQFLVERVGGDAVTVTNLAKPGAEPHDLELNPRQVGQVADAELIVYLAGFQPAVDEAVAQNGGDRAFDVAGVQPLLDAAAADHEHAGEAGHAEGGGGKDAHVWLDPTRLATIGDRLADRLGKADPGHAAGYAARAQALHGELDRLDADFAQGLRSCQRREIVTSHTAFGYLAERYRLDQVGITGLSPESEPSPRRLAEVAKEAREHGATTIFFETLVSPKVAETVAREVGARTAVLDPIEGPPAEGDYLSAMRTNLQTLRTALDCS
ncbi:MULTISPECIES: metal ABC transporter substrate-binding protein [Micromonospora]|uniref:Zinc ABC transporter substrate-binding protein n=1 Tax=Micromonospora solifontis TaxID=2487138 RepID=A0ABX9W998_9ACTN|nr:MULTISPECIES: metal ABC transporter substrate-binding protein [Micromonospora]NES17019.1 zinc ABC transporter substrate-binding protein [Micromonospora sp. PPF5-17B]NES39603.1 zinc ABC transporter substrate-binding protein [Micromonospora solifontis]NES58764.1 zinc ABC transporter substrate-binding protein [Micromonospora sp. PPF5-6]RNL87947.1 zinc ABC transporter substrate-binding protein [Micromonospora solifontis]